MAVVAAFEAVPPEDFVQHERPAGVGDVGDQRAAAQIGDALDVRLHEQMIEAVVAAGDDDGVDLRGLDQRHALIGGAVDDLVAAGGEALALLLGVRRGLEIDGEAAPGEKSPRLRREQRQRLRAGKHHDGELGRFAVTAHPEPSRNFAESHLRAVGRPPGVVAGLVDGLAPELADAPACRRPTIRRAGRCAADAKPRMSSISSKVRTKSSRFSFIR